MRTIGFVFVFAVDWSITMWSHYSLMVWRGTVELNLHKCTGIISSSFAPAWLHFKGKNRTVWRWWWPSIHVLKCCPRTDELLLPYLQTWNWSYDSEVRTYIVQQCVGHWSQWIHTCGLLFNLHLIEELKKYWTALKLIVHSHITHNYTNNDGETGTKTN